MVSAQPAMMCAPFVYAEHGPRPKAAFLCGMPPEMIPLPQASPPVSIAAMLHASCWHRNTGSGCSVMLFRNKLQCHSTCMSSAHLCACSCRWNSSQRQVWASHPVPADTSGNCCAAGRQGAPATLSVVTTFTFCVHREKKQKNPVICSAVKHEGYHITRLAHSTAITSNWGLCSVLILHKHATRLHSRSSSPSVHHHNCSNTPARLSAGNDFCTGVAVPYH